MDEYQWERAVGIHCAGCNYVYADSVGYQVVCERCARNEIMMWNLGYPIVRKALASEKEA